MNKKFIFSVALILCVPVIALAANDPLYVKVRQAKIRSEPKQWAPGVANLNYGDKVNEIGEEDGAWFKVEKGGKTGYLHSTAVSERAVVFKSTTSVAKTGNDKDVILAGKGFNKEVESKYSQTKSNLNYGEVDRMEKLSVGDSELASFIKDGQLGGN